MLRGQLGLRTAFRARQNPVWQVRRDARPDHRRLGVRRRGPRPERPGVRLRQCPADRHDARRPSEGVQARLDDANGIIYSLPQDIIDNTIRAFSVSATSTTGYGSLGPPDRTPHRARQQRELHPGGKRRLRSAERQCLWPDVHPLRFERREADQDQRARQLRVRGEFLNAFNHVNFLAAIGTFNSATFAQVTDAYRDSSNTNDPGGRLVQIVARINF